MGKKKATVDAAQASRDAVIEAIRKGFGKHSVGLLGEGGESEVTEVIPTGIDVLDHYVLGCGGLPRGRMVEVYSEEGGGKTSFTWAAIRGVQRENGVAILSETEDALNLERAETFDVDLDRVVLLEPDHLEDHLAKAECALLALNPKVPSLFVWDSIASCVTKDEVEKGLSGKEVWDSRAKTLSHACRVLSKIAKEKGTCLLFVNQVREKIGVMFGDKYTTPGGKAVKFFASIRIQLFPGKSLKNSADEHVGKLITFLTTKNRLASPYRKARVRLDYELGWNDYWSTMEHAKLLGVVSPDKTREIEKMAAPERIAARADLLKATLPVLKERAWRKGAIVEGAAKPEEGAQVHEEGEVKEE